MAVERQRDNWIGIISLRMFAAAAWISAAGSAVAARESPSGASDFAEQSHFAGVFIPPRFARRQPSLLRESGRVRIRRCRSFIIAGRPSRSTWRSTRPSKFTNRAHWIANSGQHVFNIVQFTGLNTTVNSLAFGEVTSAATMRRITFVARFRFREGN